MSLLHQAYPEYKETNTDWLGDIPKHWKAEPCRAYVNNITDKNIGAKDQNYLSLMANIGVIRYEDKGDVGNKKPDDLSKCKIVRKGNLVINSMNYAIGSYGMSDYDGVCSPVYIVLDIKEDVMQRRFALRVFENTPFQKYLATFGNGILKHRAAIGWDDIKGAYIPVPPLNEQEKILNFLDHETAKIDTLIEKQQQLIKLLKEKRQAVISHAVTKGLNPDALMRDSGVEWLGKVPEHWKVSRIKNVVTAIVDGPHFSPKYQDDGYMFISARNIKVDRWSLDDAKYISEEDFTEFNKRVRPEKGDVLLTKGGTTGIARAVDLNFPFQVWVHVAVLKIIHSKIDPFYLAYVLNGTGCYEQSQLYTQGATNNDLGLSRIAKIFFALPPLEEQKELVSWLDEKCTKFDALIAKGIESIELMQERRTALISAAVTGKIDVRNWKAPENSKSEKEDAA